MVVSPITFLAGILVYFDAYRVTKRLHPEPSKAVTMVGDRKPWLAAFLSVIIPGIGQFYNRQAMKGLGIIVLAIGAGVLEGLSPLFFIAYFLVGTLAVRDAFDSAEQYNGSTERFFKQSTTVVLLVLAMLGFKSMPFSQAIKSNFVEAFKTASGSMYPTLRFGDHFLVGKWRGFYDLPKRGDMVVFPYPENPSKQFIKRVVGVGGDKVQYIGGELYINDTQVPVRQIGPAQDEWDARSGGYEHPTVYEEQNGDAVYRVQYVGDRSALNGGPWVVPQDSVFVMGDNRERSQDSRAWGPVRVDTIRGKAIKIYWAWDVETKRVRWERIGEMLY